MRVVPSLEWLSIMMTLNLKRRLLLQHRIDRLATVFRGSHRDDHRRFRVEVPIVK